MTADSTTSPADPGLVYLHGAGLDTWIWEDLTRTLDSPQLPVSFPGRGENTAPPNALGLDDYVQHIRQQVDEWSVDHVIIVGHSIGGILGLELAGELSERVVGFVGLCAAIPHTGGSFLSCYPLHQRLMQGVLIRLLGTKPPDSAIRRSLCTGVSDEQANRIVELFTPESRRLYTDKTSAVIPSVPTRYIKTTKDNEFGPSLQDSMIDNLGADEVATLDAGHMPMLSTPHKVAEILADFQADVSRSTQ